MPKFNVEIPHALDAATAKARLEKAQSKLEAEYGANCTWASDSVMQVSRKGLDAQVKVTDSALLVDVSLGFLLTPMMGTIREGITSRLTKLVTEG